MDALDTLTSAVREDRAALARLARREGLSPEDALDAVHDAFCTYFREAQRDALPATEGDRRRYLAGIVRNAARNRRRRHHVARRHDAIDAIEPESDASDAEAQIAEAEAHLRLRACVERLCETQKAVVTLRMLEERAGEDVASALGISRGYVDVLLHRAKHALRACLTE